MYNGILNIYKEAGFTSHDVVAKLRGILGQKKIGHTGTLDPEAVGVLPVCLGKGTKVCELLTDKDKVYETVMCLGVTTDTQDMTGKVLKQSEVHVSREELEAVLETFRGNYDQIPPMYSALKVQGKKLYELAREGKTVERKARQVQILELELLEMEPDGIHVHMRVHCSKGTYIRTLCHDIGEKLGCGAAMEKLTRTQVGVFEIQDAMTLSQIEELVREGQIDHAIRTNRIDCCIMEICSAKKTLYLKRARCLGRAESAGYMTVRAGFVRFTSMTNDAKHLKMKKCLCDQEISA